MTYITYKKIQPGSPAFESRTKQKQQASIGLDTIIQDDVVKAVDIKKIYSVEVDTTKMTTGIISRQL